MRGVAGKEHTAVSEIFQGECMGAVEAEPFQGPGDVALEPFEVTRDAVTDAIFLRLRFRIVRRVELVVDAPDVPWLAVHDDRGARVAGCVEPHQTLGREFRFPMNVGNDVVALVAVALQADSAEFAHLAASTVGSHDPRRTQFAGSERGVDGQSYLVVTAGDAGDRRRPVEVHQWVGEQLVGHDLFELGLRDVDHGSARVVLGGCHPELQYFLIAVVTPTTHPR